MTIKPFEKRRLVTILAADVAEFSRLVSEDEISALNELHVLRSSMDEIITKNGGSISNSAGDSVIACFDSPLGAVLAAMEIQSVHKAHRSSVPVGKRLIFRIGINIGDVELQPNGDVLGHGVNVAARLEQIASPGGICMSANVYEHVSGKIEVSLSKLGEHYVKNISEPITVYSVGGGTQSGMSKLTGKVRALVRNPTLQVAFLFMAAVAFILSLSQARNNTFVDRPDIQLVPVLGEDISQDELLRKFDLVTKGSFQGSDYFIVRTDGLQLSELLRMADVLQGDLVAIGSNAENDYLFNLSISVPGHWKNDDGQASGPMIGLIQDKGAEEPGGGWRWANGEVLDYVNWNIKGPDNSNGNQGNVQFRNHLGLTAVPYWDDINEFKGSVIFEIRK